MSTFHPVFRNVKRAESRQTLDALEIVNMFDLVSFQIQIIQLVQPFQAVDYLDPIVFQIQSDQLFEIRKPVHIRNAIILQKEATKMFQMINVFNLLNRVVICELTDSFDETYFKQYGQDFNGNSKFKCVLSKLESVNHSSLT